MALIHTNGDHQFLRHDRSAVLISSCGVGALLQVLWSTRWGARAHSPSLCFGSYAQARRKRPASPTNGLCLAVVRLGASGTWHAAYQWRRSVPMAPIRTDGADPSPG